MTLSKAEWRAVRPDRLRNLDAAKLMESLRRKPGDSIEDWQDVLEKCTDLELVLKRTPRMLLRTMTREFEAALSVWFGDIDDLRKDAQQALEELGRAHVDDACSALARAVEQEVLLLVDTVQARIKAEKKRALEDRDRQVHAQTIADLKAQHDRIRLLRRSKMRSHLKEDRMAQEMIRGKHVRMGRFRMTCDLMLKGVQKALTDTQKDYDKLMGEGRKSRREDPA